MTKISVSRIKLFKACRRAYQFRYVEDLVPVEKAEPLEIGLAYHEKLEELYKTGEVDTSDLSRESAMALAYKKRIFPQFKVKTVEEWLSYDLPHGNQLIGRADGIAEDGWLVEHKTTSQEIGIDYEYGLQWDEQMLAYMLMTGARDIYYTVCRKPTIRKKKNETDEEFFLRMAEWYDEDTESKIQLLRLHRTDREVEDFRQALERVVADMTMAQQDEFYRNTSYCRRWGRWCEYASICLDYDPTQTYIEFTKREDVHE